MKKDRNCNGGNIAVPIYQQGIPMAQMPQPFPIAYPTNYNSFEQQINTLQQQINNLDERISKLEGKTTNNYSNKYNDSNYYML